MIRFLTLFLLPSLLFAELGYIEPWGKDAPLLQTSSQPTQSPHLSPMGQLADRVIHFHQSVLTHTCGPRSHFRPSSSQYMRQAIHKYGFITGYIMGCDRLLRENGDDWHYRATTYDGKLYKSDPPTFRARK